MHAECPWLLPLLGALKKKSCLLVTLQVTLDLHFHYRLAATSALLWTYYCTSMAGIVTWSFDQRCTLWTLHKPLLELPTKFSWTWLIRVTTSRSIYTGVDVSPRKVIMVYVGSIHTVAKCCYRCQLVADSNTDIAHTLFVMMQPFAILSWKHTPVHPDRDCLLLLTHWLFCRPVPVGIPSIEHSSSCKCSKNGWMVRWFFDAAWHVTQDYRFLFVGETLF